MPREIHIGISTCPNDTFAFHALLNNKIESGDLRFRFELLDVEQLNQRLVQGDFDVAKASFHAALHMSSELAVLASGSALGFGVGPLLLSAKKGAKPSDARLDSDRLPSVGCPGVMTTATLLYQMFYPDQASLQQMVFSKIMPKLQTGELDFGVCIHEGRFTYAENGLDCVEDLGTRWEKETSLPLPLGGILVRKSLGEIVMRDVQRCVKRSVEYGLANRNETKETMGRFAQELSDDVLFAHVDTYVNDWTVDLGELGAKSLEKLSELSAIDLQSPLKVVGS